MNQVTRRQDRPSDSVVVTAMHLESIRWMVDDLFPGFRLRLVQDGSVILEDEVGRCMRRWKPDGATMEMESTGPCFGPITADSRMWPEAMKYIRARENGTHVYRPRHDETLCLVDE